MRLKTKSSFYKLKFKIKIQKTTRGYPSTFPDSLLCSLSAGAPHSIARRGVEARLPQQPRGPPSVGMEVALPSLRSSINLNLNFSISPLFLKSHLRRLMKHIPASDLPMEFRKHSNNQASRAKLISQNPDPRPTSLLLVKDRSRNLVARGGSGKDGKHMKKEKENLSISLYSASWFVSTLVLRKSPQQEVNFDLTSCIPGGNNPIHASCPLSL